MSKPIGRPRRSNEEIRESALWQLENNYRVDKRGCHVWSGILWWNGYGRISGVRKGVGIPGRAHIAIWKLKKGVIPKGLFVCHTCDNKACINIEHLWLGTNQENQLDAVKKGVFKKYWTKKRRASWGRRMAGSGNPMFGKPGTCLGRTGKKHPFFGKHHKLSSRRKTSRSLKKHHRKKNQSP